MYKQFLSLIFLTLAFSTLHIFGAGNYTLARALVENPVRLPARSIGSRDAHHFAQVFSDGCSNINGITTILCVTIFNRNGDEVAFWAMDDASNYLQSLNGSRPFGHCYHLYSTSNNPLNEL